MLTDNTLATTAPELDLAAIRHSLEQQRQEREDIIHDLADSAAPNVDPVAWSTTRAARGVIAQITAALERLDTGTYGLCIRCDGTIMAGRLEALPYAAHCIDCQSRSESA